MSEQYARLFHDTYERLAPQFGYETRKDTRAFDPESANGKLMIAVCTEVLATARADALEEGFKAGIEAAAKRCESDPETACAEFCAPAIRALMKPSRG